MHSARVFYGLALALPVWLAGCATPLPEPPPRPDTPIVRSTVQARPDIEPAKPSAVVPMNRDSIAVLFSGSMPTQAAIAGRITEGLSREGAIIRRIDIDAVEATATMDDAAPTDIVAAVGPEALAFAQRAFTGAEIIFSQVLEPEIGAGAIGKIRGVTPIPPPALQLAGWTAADPGLKRIGLITSSKFSTIVPAVEQAASRNGAELVHRVSTSDRETLYIFRRLAPDIDGFWLAPDGAILSATVIEEILAYASELKIGVLVFSESLLERGGLISVSATSESIADAVIDAIGLLRAGRGSSLPAEIPLTEAYVRINAGVAADLGLPVKSPTEWTVRDRQ